MELDLEKLGLPSDNERPEGRNPHAYLHRGSNT